MPRITHSESTPPASGIAPLEKDGTRQNGCEKEALGRKKELSVDSCSSGVPLHSDVMTPAISLTATV